MRLSGRAASRLGILRRVEAGANERLAVRDPRRRQAKRIARRAAVRVVRPARVRDAAGAVDQHAVERIAETAPHRGEPVDAAAVEAARVGVEQRDIAALPSTGSAMPTLGVGPRTSTLASVMPASVTLGAVTLAALNPPGERNTVS